MITSKITNKQQQAAEKVRRYLREQRLTPEKDFVTEETSEYIPSAHLIEFYITDRESAGDYQPPQHLMDRFYKLRDELNSLSPYIFAHVTSIDEWAELTIRVRKKKRYDRPKVDRIKVAEEVAANLPIIVSGHDRVTNVAARDSAYNDGGVMVKTNIPGRYDDIIIELTWKITGDWVKGWRFTLNWGKHTISRPAAFKKLSASMILTQFKRLLSQLSHPLDAGEWTYTAKDANGHWIIGRRGENKLFDHFMVHHVDRSMGKDVGPAFVRANEPAVTVMFTNDITGEVIERKNWELWPVLTDPIHLDEKSYLLPKGDKLRDKDAELAGVTSDGIPIYFGYKDLEYKDYSNLMFWVTPYAGKIEKTYLRAGYIDKSLEESESWPNMLAKWSYILSNTHSSKIVDLINKFGGQMAPE